MSPESIALFTNLLLGLILLVIGWRLLLLARRTRQLPELILGVSSCAAGASMIVPIGLIVLGQTPDQMGLWAVLSRVFVAVSVITIALLAWKVFRPGSGRSQIFFIVLSASVSIYVFVNPQIGPDAPEGDELLWWPVWLSMVASYVWAAAEAYLYQSALRRRQRFGLAAKSLVPDRVRLWSWALGLSAFLYAWHLMAAVAEAYFSFHLPSLFMTSILGVIISVCLWLAFFPVRRFERGGSVS